MRSQLMLGENRIPEVLEKEEMDMNGIEDIKANIKKNVSK
jgi:hypothetical protein